jgi:hypothetical protein
MALQDDSAAQVIDLSEESVILTMPALQDLYQTQALVLTGLIAHLTGAALQEDIADTARRLQQLALDIQGDGHGAQTAASPGTPTPGAHSVQLDRSPAGA